MDFKLLEAFHTVVSNSSITKAAEILGVTQPAVSAQIARLEASLGFSLFARNGGRLSLTTEGQQFHAQVVHALGMFQRLDRVAEGIRDGTSGKLVIASHPSASISLIPVLMARFRKDNPETRIRLINRTSEEVRSFFPAASIDIGIAELPTDIAGVEVRKYALKCVAVLPRRASCLREIQDHTGRPFGRTVSRHALREGDLASYPRGIFCRGRNSDSIGEVDFFSSICAMVAEGGGVSIVDAWSARMFGKMGMQVRPFEPAIPYEIGVITSSEWPLSRTAQAFLSLIDETLREEAHHVSQADA